MAKIRNLGLAFIGLGFVELAWVAFCLFGGMILGVAGLVDEELVGVGLALGGVYGLLALANLPIAMLHIFTGLQLRKGRGLMWLLASIAATLVSMILALYCMPLSVAVLIYAIVVVADPVARDRLDGVQMA